MCRRAVILKYKNYISCYQPFLYFIVFLFHENKVVVTISLVLYSCDRASWAKCEGRIPTRCNNVNDLLSIPDVDYWLLSRHVSGTFMPIIRRKDHVLHQETVSFLFVMRRDNQLTNWLASYMQQGSSWKPYIFLASSRNSPHFMKPECSLPQSPSHHLFLS